MEGRCRKHPQHIQAKGICPNCLRERLQHLSTSFSSSTTTLASSSAASSSSISSSAVASPPHHHDLNYDDHQHSNIIARSYGDHEKLNKSKSLAFVVEKKLDKDVKNSHSNDGDSINSSDKMVRNLKKKKSFWSKLINISRKRSKEVDGRMSRLDYSKTLKEKISSKWNNIF